MLELQRASAGSGKTYALARKFIWYYITVRDSEDPGALRRLRTDKELTDSLSHILAVTFTNKATSEMQQRIVEKLYALGYSAPGERTDYLKEFVEDLRPGDPDVTEEKVRSVCRMALSILLNHYSDFQVSTIDSFFQRVLRTFAYESDLNDSYHIELDSDYLSAMAIDRLLHDVNAGTAPVGKFWLRELMQEAARQGKKYNVFARNPNSDNPYKYITQAVKHITNEEFKMIRPRLEAYFKSEGNEKGKTPEDLLAIYRDMKKRYEEPVEEAFKGVLKKRKAFNDVLSHSSIHDTDRNKYKSQLNKFTSKGRVSTWVPFKADGHPDPLEKISSAKAYQGRRAKAEGDYEIVEKAYAGLEQAIFDWEEALNNNEVRHWIVYRNQIPFLGLLEAIRRRRDEYLRENNAIELAETNTLLQHIINPDGLENTDDTPFIYERLGTRLNHYLIDEFQDTSRMQWMNFKPLLLESVGRGEENLVIGDAKQSIYRFRNADSTLISKVVPSEFSISNKEETSTNWRSDLRIIQFNNTFFTWLTTVVNNLAGSGADSGRADFTQDYVNVIQEPHHKDPRGYVELRFDTAGGRGTGEIREEIPVLIEELLDRGYKQSDIAVLSDTNAQGVEVIDELTRYNACEDSRYKIEFVSETSLKLISSAAISIIVSVLEAIARGADPTVRDEAEAAKKGAADWAEIRCSFRYYAARPENQGMTMPERMMMFLQKLRNKELGEDLIQKMLGKMQAVSLPALVESITAEFVPEDLRKDDAVFLAAFQDTVLEYSESHPSDVGSFLQWWDEKKDKRQIASPDDMEAVKVMTVHKSKGLEFPVVIMPFVESDFSDAPPKDFKEEWRWVKPEVVESPLGALPEVVPVYTNEKLLNTSHEKEYHKYQDVRKKDRLNFLYVGFTRAVNELYIFVKGRKKDSGKKNGEKPYSDPELNMGSLLNDFMEWCMDSSKVSVRMMDPSMIDRYDEGENAGFLIYTYGAKSNPESKTVNTAVEAEKLESDDLNPTIGTYNVRSTPSFLTYRMENALPEVIESEEDEDELELLDDPDPRSEGKLMHAVMEQIERREDIRRAARRLVIQGKIDRQRGAEISEFLMMRTGEEAVREWFSGKMRVINERSLIRQATATFRPDRIMIDPEGNAIVVDYKFGESHKTARLYKRQVRDYVSALKDTGMFRSVRGYLWYVKLGEVRFITD